MANDLKEAEVLARELSQVPRRSIHRLPLSKMAPPKKIRPAHPGPCMLAPESRATLRPSALRPAGYRAVPLQYSEDLTARSSAIMLSARCAQEYERE